MAVLVCTLWQENADELAVLESLDNGKPYAVARAVDVPMVRHIAKHEPMQLCVCAIDPRVSGHTNASACQSRSKRTWTRDARAPFGIKKLVCLNTVGILWAACGAVHRAPAVLRWLGRQDLWPDNPLHR